MATSACRKNAAENLPARSLPLMILLSWRSANDRGDARVLGQRLAALRFRYGLSVADVADAAGLRHHQIEEFEAYGAVSAETLLWLIEVLCRDDSLADAFRTPSFRDRDDFRRRWHGGSNVVSLRR